MRFAIDPFEHSESLLHLLINMVLIHFACIHCIQYEAIQQHCVSTSNSADALKLPLQALKRLQEFSVHMKKIIEPCQAPLHTLETHERNRFLKWVTLFRQMSYICRDWQSAISESGLSLPPDIPIEIVHGAIVFLHSQLELTLCSSVFALNIEEIQVAKFNPVLSRYEFQPKILDWSVLDDVKRCMDRN